MTDFEKLMAKYEVAIKIIEKHEQTEKDLRDKIEHFEFLEKMSDTVYTVKTVISTSDEAIKKLLKIKSEAESLWSELREIGEDIADIY